MEAFKDERIFNDGLYSFLSSKPDLTQHILILTKVEVKPPSHPPSITHIHNHHHPTTITQPPSPNPHKLPKPVATLAPHC